MDSQRAIPGSQDSIGTWSAYRGPMWRRGASRSQTVNYPVKSVRCGVARKEKERASERARERERERGREKERLYSRYVAILRSRAPGGYCCWTYRDPYVWNPTLHKRSICTNLTETFIFRSRFRERRDLSNVGRLFFFASAIRPADNNPLAAYRRGVPPRHAAWYHLAVSVGEKYA